MGASGARPCRTPFSIAALPIARHHGSLLLQGAIDDTPSPTVDRRHSPAQFLAAHARSLRAAVAHFSKHYQRSPAGWSPARTCGRWGSKRSPCDWIPREAKEAADPRCSIGHPAAAWLFLRTVDENGPHGCRYACDHPHFTATAPPNIPAHCRHSRRQDSPWGYNRPSGVDTIPIGSGRFSSTDFMRSATNAFGEPLTYRRTRIKSSWLSPYGHTLDRHQLKERGRHGRRCHGGSETLLSSESSPRPQAPSSAAVYPSTGRRATWKFSVRILPARRCSCAGS